MKPARAAACVLAAALAACSDPPAPVAVVRREAPPTARAEPPAPPPRDARLRADVGGWTPPAALLDLVEGMGDPARKPAALAKLDALTPDERIDALRAGLRLAETPAAMACAARLEWRQIDGWECARCVDLLKSEVLRKGTEADFDEFRSYLGTADLAAFLDALPPRPWAVKVDTVFGDLHRILHEDALDAWAKAMRHPRDSDIANAAVAEWSATVLPRCDRRCEETYRLFQPFGTVIAPVEGPGLSAELVRKLKEEYLYDLRPDPDDNPLKQEMGMSPWASRWMLASTPGPRDEALLVELARRCDGALPGRNAIVLLGRIRGELSDAFLSEQARDDEHEFAWAAIAMRGGAGGVDRLVAWTAEDDAAGLAALMEADPVRARKEIEARVLGADEAAALAVLGQLVEFLPPGAESWEARPFRFQRMRWDGFAAKALATPMSALRRARLGAVVPVCRTRAAAEAACRDLDASYLLADRGDESDAFLETGAPHAFRAALRRFARGPESDARDAALDALLTVGDPESGPLLVAERWGRPELLARSTCPEVVAFLTKELREGSASNSEAARAHGGGGVRRVPRAEEETALAQALGAPEGLEWPVEPSAAVREALLAGDWRGAYHRVLADQPDAEHGCAGGLRDDDVVRAWLDSLRTRRSVGLYWYATGELAVAGDPAARAEFWQAMQYGRYRIRDDASRDTKALGDDLAATGPFWIEQLRASCCVVAGNPCDRWFDIGAFESTSPPAYERAREIWDAAGGADGLVWSRVAERYVIRPR